MPSLSPRKMAKFLHLLCYFLLALASTLAAAAPQPLKALVAPITQLNFSSPLLTITLNRNEKLLIDIESPFSWHHCRKGAFPHVACRTSQCVAAQSYKPPYCRLPTPKCSYGKTNCVTLPANPITKTCALSQLTYARVTTNSTDGHSPISTVSYNKVYMSCAPKTLFRGLPNGSSGIASLSKGPLSLVSQFTTSKVPKKFALCFGPQGVAFFGEGPFYLNGPTGLDNLTQLLNYVPLLTRPNDPLGYYIGLKSISVGGQAVKFPQKVPQVAKLSTVTPYTILRSDIYRALVDQFSKAMKQFPQVPKVAPFELCFKSSSLPFDRIGPVVPRIDLGLATGWNWTMIGFNSIVRLPGDAACLAFVDGGDKAEQGAVIGMYQMMQSFLQFDLVKSRLGLSGLLFFVPTNCDNFNFTSGGMN